MARTPCLFTFLFYPERCVLELHKRYMIDANVLDIVVIKETETMLVSVDNVHVQLSTKEPASHKIKPLIYAFALQFSSIHGAPQYDWIRYRCPIKGQESAENGSFEDIASRLEDTLQAEDILFEIELEKSVQPKALYSSLGEFLYGLEHLRKRSHGNGEEQQAEGLDGTHPAEL
jgi:hypothetical protein